MIRIRLFAFVALLALLAAGCAGEDALQGGGAPPPGAGSEAAQAGTVVIGSTNFSEQLVLANMFADLIEARGLQVDRRLNLGSREVVFPALTNGDIDILPDYNGALLLFLDENSPAKTPEEVTGALRQALPPGITTLEPGQAQDADALAVTQETAQRYGLQNTTDLAPVAGELILGGPPELETRPQGLPGLRRVYGIEFRDFRALDAGGPLTTEALQSGQVDVARVFSTQGSIGENGWVVLADDKFLAPAQNIIPVARQDALTPDIEQDLNRLMSTITEEDLIAINSRVDTDKEDPEVVAREYLQQKGLLG